MHFIEASARSFQWMTKVLLEESKLIRLKQKSKRNEIYSIVLQNLSLSFSHFLFFLRDFGLRNGLHQTSFEADRYLSNVNGNGEVEMGKVKDEEGKWKHDNEILQVQ